MNIIEKSVRTGNGFKERLHIKAFKTSDAMHKFLNKQYDNTWKISDKELKSGVYVFAGGQYLNVKKVDPCALAHM